MIVGGRYQLTRHLAAGGMADVHLAQDLTLDREVAVKILSDRYAADPRFVARFRQEATSAAKLSHHRIVQVYDWGPHEDTYFIVMEHVRGMTLADLLAREGPLPQPRAIEMATMIADGLAYAHDAGTVHRDIKPANILVGDDGGLKLADFGIARAVEAERDLTEVGTVLGTVAYISPEQARGERVGTGGDLYALGVVLFEMVTGTVPFSDQSSMAVAIKHVSEPAPSARDRNPAVSPALDELIGRLLAKNPDQRHADASELRAALAAVESEATPAELPDHPVAPTGSAPAGLAPAGLAPTEVMPNLPHLQGSVQSPPDRIVDRPSTTAGGNDDSAGRSGWIYALALLLVAVVGVLIFLPRIVDGIGGLDFGDIDLGGDPDPTTTTVEPTDAPPVETTVEQSTTTEGETSSTTSTTEPSSTSTTTTQPTTATQPSSTTTATTATTASTTTDGA